MMRKNRPMTFTPSFRHVHWIRSMVFVAGPLFCEIEALNLPLEEFYLYPSNLRLTTP